MSLYRTYRPQTFTDVVGQDHIVTTLENAAAQDKLSHAYLFAGSRGTGKTSVARILAKILMLQKIEDETLQKQIIQAVEDGNIVDLMEIDAASNRGIDDIRDLIEKIQFSPVVAGAKVYIIDEVHMLTKEAFNALLKTLEEPPEYAYFILATTELNKIPTTIQSRCQCFPFRQIPEEEIIRRLQFIADQERITIDRDALRVIAHHVQGGLRDAISLLDQLRALEHITREDVEQRIGGSSHEQTEAIFQALAEGNAEGLFQAIQKVEEAGIAMDVFVRELLGMVRDNLHLAIEEGKPTDNALKMQSALLDALRDIRTSPVPALVLEASLLSLLTPTSTSDVTAAAKEIQEKADKKKEKKEVKKEKAEKEENAEEPEEKQQEPEEVTEEEKPATLEAPELSSEAMKEVWNRIVEETNPPSVRMSLKNGRVVDIDGSKVTLGFSSEFHRDKVGATDAARAVEEIMTKIFKQSVRLDCVLEEGEAVSEPKQDAVNLAEAAAEVF